MICSNDALIAKINNINIECKRRKDLYFRSAVENLYDMNSTSINFGVHQYEDLAGVLFDDLILLKPDWFKISDELERFGSVFGVKLHESLIVGLYKFIELHILHEIEIGEDRQYTKDEFAFIAKLIIKEDPSYLNGENNRDKCMSFSLRFKKQYPYINAGMQIYYELGEINRIAKDMAKHVDEDFIKNDKYRGTPIQIAKLEELSKIQAAKNSWIKYCMVTIPFVRLHCNQKLEKRLISDVISLTE